MYSALISKTRGALGVALVLASHPLAAMEELTVEGAMDAARTRAHQALFESQMEAYTKSVGAEFKELLKAELEAAMRTEAQLAAVAARRRG